MYKRLIRPACFLIDPETVHHQVISLLKFGFSIPGIRQIFRRFSGVNSPDLKKTIFGLTFTNPVGIAAGFDKNAHCFNELADLGFGFIEIGTVTPKGQAGNPKKRLFRLPNDHAIINRMGFNNTGLEAAIRNLKKRHTKAIIGGNLGKNTLTPNSDAIYDYLTVFEGLFDYVDYFVVNVSCPNITDLRELQDQDALIQILEKLQQANRSKKQSKPILLKVSPDLNEAQLDEVIDLATKKLIEGVVAVNTTVSREGLQANKETLKSIGNGGLSGLPLKKRSTEIIRYLAQKSGKAFPIIGVGGIETPEDAIEKLEAGADLVQVYTGFIYEGPFIAKKINRKLAKYYAKSNS